MASSSSSSASPSESPSRSSTNTDQNRSATGTPPLPPALKQSVPKKVGFLVAVKLPHCAFRRLDYLHFLLSCNF